MENGQTKQLFQECRVLAEGEDSKEDELKKWNDELEMYVQQQTIELTRQNQEYQALYKKMKSGFKDFTITISNLLELRDKTVASHSNNVAMLSAALAREIGLDEQETEKVAVAAQLHDIGKIGVSDAVLLKDVETLAPYEREEYMTHPVRGQAVLASNEVLRDAGVFIRHHHEAFDGTGFPDGLKAHDIPLGSRIIALADTYDKLLHTHSPEKALEVMRSLSGRQFDPDLLHPFLEVAGEIAKTGVFRDHTVEIEMHPKDLASDMVISRDVRSGTGLLLMSKGVVLNTKKIDSLRRHYNLDPPKTGVFVWTEKREGM